MNTFIVSLNCDYTQNVENYLKQSNIEITFFDHILHDLIIIKTNLTKEEVNKIKYVKEAKKPRVGGFKDMYMNSSY